MPKNAENIEKQLELKQKIGEFYGFPTVCELNLEERMAATVDNVKNFMSKLRDKAFNVYLADISRLEQKYNIKMKPWSLNYYVEKDKTDVCEFDIQ